MLTQQQRQSKPFIQSRGQSYKTDRAAFQFLVLAMSYLVLGLSFGLLGGMQYILPSFLREHLSFQRVRPLHVFLVISWIFTAAQAGLYYYLPRFFNRQLYWQNGVRLHLILQAMTSLSIVVAFFGGHFGGREYLEFPPVMGLAIAASWLPLTVNFFKTAKFNLTNAPVYLYSWTLGILFFYITLAENYLWIFDYFRTNEIRDITVQWKALGSMVGSWNMLVYGTGMYVMEKLSGNARMARSPIAFSFFFLGFINLLFNWGHHTYIVPAAPWVKTIAYIISMTELLIFGKIIWQWRKSLTNAQRNFHNIPYRFLSYADAWIFLNLGVAIAISIPQLNYYTHGTHITVAHAMGTTIGINTMLLFASIFYMLQEERASLIIKMKTFIAKAGDLTNMALVLFWAALVGSGLVKISGRLENESFQTIMNKCAPYFKVLTVSGAFIWIGLGMLIIAALKIIFKKQDSGIEVFATVRTVKQTRELTG